jgi:DNA-binding winged helix-turn-helix (wHTH) protein/Tol biopolymer transport system component
MVKEGASGISLMDRQVRFGPFTFDQQTGALRKNGLKVNLQEKPRQILIALLERPGQMVSRKVLQERLWSNDTFVDFESGLNTAANRLRIALGDSAESPTYIETLARSGYRFIGEIAEVPAQQQPVLPKRPSRRTVPLALAILAAASVWWMYPHPVKQPPKFTQVTFRRGPIEGARFGADGHTILYSAKWESEPWRVFLTNRTSPETRTVGFDGSILSAVSPSDELSLLSWEQVWSLSGGALSRVPLNGGVPREVTTRVTFSDWSRDGKDMAVMRFNGGESQLEFPIGKPLYTSAGLLSGVKISRDGSKFAFFEHPHRNDDGGELKVFEQGRGVHTLSSGWASAGGLAWSASGKEVWFTASREGERRALWGVTLDGRLRLLWQGPGSLALQDISPDGRVLLTQEERHLEMAGSSPTVSGERDLSWFDWSCAEDISTDGSLVLFDETGEGGGAKGTVYLRRMTDGSVLRLGEGSAIALAPDGSAVLTLDESNRGHLNIVPLGEGRPQELSGRGVEYHRARYFPDGQHLAVLGSEPGRPVRLYIQDLHGGKPEPLRPDVFLRSIVISPNGKKIAGTDESDQLVVVDLSGAPPKRFSTHAYPVGWSADGRSILARDARQATAPLSRVDPTTGRSTRWKEIRPSTPTGVSGILRMFFTPDEQSYVYSYYRDLAQLYVTDPWAY